MSLNPTLAHCTEGAGGQADIFNLLGLLLELGRSYLPQEAGTIEEKLEGTSKFLSLFVVLASSWICGLICGL